MVGQDKSSVINGETPPIKGQPPTRRRLSWAYIAGFIDADGCINICRKRASRRYQEKRYYRITVQVVQDEKYAYLLKALQEKVEGQLNPISVYLNGIKYQKKNWKWAVSNMQAYRLLKKIQSKLILKREQALVAMRLQENILKWKNKPNYNCNERLPDKVMAYREKLRLQNKALNKHSSLVAETESEDPIMGSDSPNSGNGKSRELKPEVAC